MSYYVIKGPFSGRNYLCSLPGYKTPQWLDGKEGREKANRFPDEDSAWKYIQLIVRENPKFDTGRVVRVNTLRDWKAERAQLRADRDNYRALTDIMRIEIKSLTRERDEAKALVETREAKLDATPSGGEDGA